MDRFDIAIVGGGIVGLATAHRALERWPGRRVIVLEKERELAAHQSGHNSGVLHAGIYYAPGSARARWCRRGRLQLEAFCRREGVAFERCGKVVVATHEAELPRLEALLARARANEVACERIGPERLRELEPHAAGLAALHVPETGIVDFRAVCGALARRIRAAGGELRTGARLVGARTQPGALVLETTQGAFEAARAVGCAGLHSDRVAAAFGVRTDLRIVPFRGEYHELAGSARGLVRNLVYPVPDPAFPFLGVHLTRTIGGAVECGPNAVLALAREGYRWRDVSPRDLLEALLFPGFARLAARTWRTALGEVRRSLSRDAFARALRRLVPALEPAQLVPAGAGVRAQALGPDGALVDDFRIARGPRSVHVLNAPSPAATASFAIADAVLDVLAQGAPAAGADAPLGETGRRG